MSKSLNGESLRIGVIGEVSDEVKLQNSDRYLIITTETGRAVRVLQELRSLSAQVLKDFG